jgi:pimeloyl-ACP methyl ester carboxylesterase
MTIIGGYMKDVHNVTASRIKTAAVLALLLNASISYAEELLCSPVAVYRDDKSPILYYLQKKDSRKNSHDLLVILQGSDCNSVRNIKAVAKLKKIYNSADLLTVEKYGVTEALPYSSETERKDYPPGYIEHDNPEQRADDIDRVITCLRKNYHYTKILVIGGSEGALVALLLASKVHYVTATVAFGGGARRFKDDVFHCMRNTYTDKDKLDKDIEGFSQFCDYVVSGEPFPIDMSNHGYSWWKIMLSYDQEKILAAIQTPVLIMEGSEDTNASPEKAREMYNDLVKQGKKNIDFRWYEGYNHSLNLSVPDNSSDRVIRDVQKWLSGKI